VRNSNSNLLIRQLINRRWQWYVCTVELHNIFRNSNSTIRSLMQVRCNINTLVWCDYLMKTRAQSNENNARIYAAIIIEIPRRVQRRYNYLLFMNRFLTDTVWEGFSIFKEKKTRSLTPEKMKIIFGSRCEAFSPLKVYRIFLALYPLY